jgi:hypothetical protein
MASNLSESSEGSTYDDLSSSSDEGNDIRAARGFGPYQDEPRRVAGDGSEEIGLNLDHFFERETRIGNRDW